MTVGILVSLTPLGKYENKLIHTQCIVKCKKKVPLTYWKINMCFKMILHGLLCCILKVPAITQTYTSGASSCILTRFQYSFNAEKELACRSHILFSIWFVLLHYLHTAVMPRPSRKAPNHASEHLDSSWGSATTDTDLEQVFHPYSVHSRPGWSLPLLVWCLALTQPSLYITH